MIFAKTLDFSINPRKDSREHDFIHKQRHNIMQVEQIDLPAPWPGANRNLLGLGGSWIDPIKRLNTFDPDQFETFTLQWANEYLTQKYHQVQKRGGAGDKGRDIVAWIDPPKIKQARWDSYQCKHYTNPLAPSDIWLEFGKLCYYTFNKHFTVPQSYFIVSPNGIGSKLQDFIDKPETIHKELIKNWGKYCESKITSKAKVPLNDSFKAYIETFDFSIISALLPHELIEQHSKTKYHSYVFGTQLNPRPTPPKPPVNIAAKETRYVEQIYEAFADHLKCEIKARSSFSHKKHLGKAFDHARESFYSAESLKEFARDNLPDESYFTDLLTQFFDGLQTTLYQPHKDGYERMIAASKQAGSLQIDTNILRETLRQNDRVGICHQLANEDKLKWVD